VTGGNGNGHDHADGCACTRCRGFEPGNTHGEKFKVGNTVALVHGATSERQIVRRATVEKRRVLRQIGLREADLESLGRALLRNWARSAAALYLMDAYAERHGWLDADGNPRGFARLYVSMMNSELRALRALESYLRKRDDTDPVARLYEGLARR
jgi:hypothetical protein